MTARSEVGARAPWREVVVDGVRLAYDDAEAGLEPGAVAAAAPAADADPDPDPGAEDALAGGPREPVLVCLHAIGHGARDFVGLRERLGGEVRVIALDWPGQGRSGDDRAAASAVRYAALLAGFLDAVGLRRVVLLGNSIGGAAALAVAAARPERVAGLVLLNPGGLGRIDWLVRVATRLMARFFAAGARRARWFPWAFRRDYRMVLRNRAARAQRDRIAAAGYEIAPVLAQAWRSFGEGEADQRALVERVACPVLVAWATRDRIVQLRRSQATIARFARARLVTFDAGHAPHLENPDAFAAVLGEFLARLAFARAPTLAGEAAPWDGLEKS